MSLLMQALKKAEDAKRRTVESLPGVPPDETASHRSRREAAEAAPTPSRPHEGTPIADLATQFDAADPVAVPVSRPAAETNGGPRRTRIEAEERRDGSRQRDAAFDPVAPGHTVRRNGRRIAFLLGLAVLVAAALTGYFGWQLRAIPLQQPVASSIPPSASTHANLPAAVPDAPQATVPPARPDVPAAAAGRNAMPVEPPEPTFAAPAGYAPPSVARTADGMAKRTPASSPEKKTARPESPSPDSALRLTKTPPRGDRELERAYAALMAERLDEAQAGYEQVLRADAKNTDALLGLATIAARRGFTDRAHAYYLLALESDPTHPTARAGVASTQGLVDAERTESRLKIALSERPDSAPLLFALGNLYAGQERWSEAQQAYFQAYAAEPDNPDLLFNVAVSLDHLRKSPLAARYYQMALSASESRPAAFDRAQVIRRLAELQQP